MRRGRPNESSRSVCVCVHALLSSGKHQRWQTWRGSVSGMVRAREPGLARPRHRASPGTPRRPKHKNKQDHILITLPAYHEKESISRQNVITWSSWARYSLGESVFSVSLAKTWIGAFTGRKTACSGAYFLREPRFGTPSPPPASGRPSAHDKNQWEGNDTGCLATRRRQSKGPILDRLRRLALYLGNVGL